MHIKDFFSNKFRWLKIIIIAIGILAMCLYSYVFGPGHQITLYQCLDNPENCENVSLSISYCKVGEINKNYFELLNDQQKILVKGSPRQMDNLAPRATVSLRAILKLAKNKNSGLKKELNETSPSGYYLLLQEIHIHRLQNFKRLISGLTFFLVLFLFAVEYKFDLRDFVFKKRYA